MNGNPDIESKGICIEERLMLKIPYRNLHKRYM